MAGRPLKAEVTTNKNGTASIRVPVARGSSERRTLRFPTPEQAERYQAAFTAAWKANAPLPDPTYYQSSRGNRRQEVEGDGFAEVALAWFKRTYPESYHNPETADRVQHMVNAFLIPFFASRVDHIGDIEYSDVVDFADHLAGVRAPIVSSKGVVAEARDYTLAEAAQWTGLSKSTIRKAWLGKKFRHAYLDQSATKRGVVMIPVGDLIDAGYFPGTKKAEVPYGYSKSQAGELLGTLRRIFKYARANKLLTSDPAEGVQALSPDPSANSIKPKSEKSIFLLELADAKRVARHLHLHHQLAYWLMRVMGLRISESYGIDLGDISRDEGRMIINVWQQGGKKFKVRMDGRTVITDKKKQTKTKSGTRLLPVPQPLSDLIEVYIDAFHHDALDPETPLLQTRGLAQSGCRSAIEAAHNLEGLGEVDSAWVFRRLSRKPRPIHTSDL